MELAQQGGGTGAGETADEDMLPFSCLGGLLEIGSLFDIVDDLGKNGHAQGKPMQQAISCAIV